MTTDKTIAESVKFLYPCPVLQHVFDDTQRLNVDLKNILLMMENDKPELSTGGINRSNVAGWKSNDDLLKSSEPAINDLTQRVVKAIEALMSAAPKKNAPNAKGMQIYAWANINREGSYNTMHSHPGNHWAAVYYVDTGKPDPQRPMSGLFEIQDPRTSAGAMHVPGFDFGDKISVRPKPGMLLVFPAWMNHCVHPYFGEGERISIAFNVRLEV